MLGLANVQLLRCCRRLPLLFGTGGRRGEFNQRVGFSLGQQLARDGSDQIAHWHSARGMPMRTWTPGIYVLHDSDVELCFSFFYINPRGAGRPAVVS